MLELQSRARSLDHAGWSCFILASVSVFAVRLVSQVPPLVAPRSPQPRSAIASTHCCFTWNSLTIVNRKQDSDEDEEDGTSEFFAFHRDRFGFAEEVTGASEEEDSDHDDPPVTATKSRGRPKKKN